MSVFPIVSADSAPLWDGYAEGEIRLPWCRACGRAHLPPGPACPFCLSDALEWRRASGRGVIGTFAVVERRYFEDFTPPYVFVQVALDEGPRLPASFPIALLDRLAVGLPVEAGFARAPNGHILPVFAPMQDASA